MCFKPFRTLLILISTIAINKTEAYNVSSIYDTSALGAMKEAKCEEDDNKKVTLLRWPGLTFPGTKWCGPGNMAHGNELGIFADVDACCRTHDFCPDLMGIGESKHNLTNPALYTRLNCTCDTEFYACLKHIDSLLAREIGNIFFNLLGTQCFRKDFPIVRCIRRRCSPIVVNKCLAYEYDTTKDKIYQWFDEPDF